MAFRVYASTSAAGAESAEEQRRRKLQRKTERRKEKAAAAEANVANFTAYVTGIPKEVVWTAVQTLFSKAGGGAQGQAVQGCGR